MDDIDRRLLALIQRDATATVAEISDRIGISSTPVWKRLKSLEKTGVIRCRVALLDSEAIGLKLTGFVLIRTSDHSEGWLAQFAGVLAEIPEVIEVHRMAGDIDYILKVVAPDMEGYDRIYKRLIKKVKLSDVSASFSMELIKATTVLPLDYAN
ncbi:Lrp/AsnC family transcriptional regulator [Altererythrobacter arenosus]|uniref:Lrp/AsnC family transcriptional regulator n=1 Tax=Altererythrobacter arenosus TaxID=3032592 RepID=A0ABY8FMB0_9SPHN|nr:Lrp/AsnC family transcriptional regulator [Altererythrobacter sp. CAU 1644]WFL76155.1 Lrp/AsnC family transcriptional regulator [Altererythrobacter sp. CAU 1644]